MKSFDDAYNYNMHTITTNHCSKMCYGMSTYRKALYKNLYI